METPDQQEAFVYQTKQWRKDLDECLQRLKQGSDIGYTGERAPDHPVRSSRERSLAITKIEEAIMWLGMDLKAQNTPNPYPHSKELRETLESLMPIFTGKFLMPKEHEAVKKARDILSNSDSTTRAAY